MFILNLKKNIKRQLLFFSKYTFDFNRFKFQKLKSIESKSGFDLKDDQIKVYKLKFLNIIKLRFCFITKK